ncbi:MAG: TetR/AcrR family transcriptional regulator [Thermoleophilia bacterium]|nr:TetR/AcrR family transcriptional regulator [Thermoleophilia bacterium]
MIDAIAELSAEQGYEATKIAAIVSRAGVARKTLYDNFDGKEDLLLSAFDLYFKETMTAVEAACENAGDDWQQRIESGLAAFLRFIVEQPSAARLCMVEALSATPKASASYDAAVRAFVELLKRNAPPQGELPETIEETLVGGVAWILHQRIRAGEASKANDLLPELSRFVLSPYHGVTNSGPLTAKRK